MSEKQILSAQCPISGGNSIFTGETYKDNGTSYSLYRCQECDVEFWTPMKNPGAEWYQHDDRYASRNRDPLMTPVNTHRAFLSDHLSPGGTLLDIGCGTGNFLNAARKAGYKVRGIDFDSDAIRVAKEVFGLEDVSVASVESLSKEGKRYDIVTFFEVLEHMENPNKFLESVTPLLTPSGYIALSVPFRGFWDALKRGDRPPRHLTRWNERSMEAFLSRHGYEIVRLKKPFATIDFLVTKFHFWTKGFLSFGVVSKVMGKTGKEETLSPRRSLAVSLLKKTAKIKDYVLFILPALILAALLFTTSKGFSSLYVLARKK